MGSQLHRQQHSTWVRAMAHWQGTALRHLHPSVSATARRGHAQSSGVTAPCHQALVASLHHTPPCDYIINILMVCSLTRSVLQFQTLALIAQSLQDSLGLVVQRICLISSYALSCWKKIIICNNYTVHLFNGKEICHNSLAKTGFTSRQCSEFPAVALGRGGGHEAHPTPFIKPSLPSPSKGSTFKQLLLGVLCGKITCSGYASVFHGARKGSMAKYV